MAKQTFSSFDYEAAFKALAIERLLPWTLPIQELTPTDFFVERFSFVITFQVVGFKY